MVNLSLRQSAIWFLYIGGLQSIHAFRSVSHLSRRRIILISLGGSPIIGSRDNGCWGDSCFVEERISPSFDSQPLFCHYLLQPRCQEDPASDYLHDEIDNFSSPQCQVVVWLVVIVISISSIRSLDSGKLEKQTKRCNEPEAVRPACPNETTINDGTHQQTLS